MKTEGEIRQKLKQVIFRHLKARLRSNFKPSPGSCIHNVLVSLRNGGEVGVCHYTDPSGIPRGVVCDEQVDEGVRAQECPLWVPSRTKSEVREDFQELLGSSDRGKIAAEYPDIAALIWVLQDEALGGADPEGGMPALEVSPEDDPETKGWDWGRWPWSRFRGVPKP